MLHLNELSPFVICYFLFFVSVIGLCVGSFSNVVILRGLSEESIIFPPSKCPKCLNKLKWYHNIPVLSYLFLRGKCAFCKEPISIQYPLVEIVSALLYVFVFVMYEFSYTTLFMWAIVSLFLILSVTDLKEKVILTHHAYILAGVGVLYNFVHKEFLLPLLGIIVGFAVMEALARLGEVLFSRRAFGEGDSYIGAAIGAIIGWKFFLFSLLGAILIQTFLILPMYLFKLIKSKQYALFTSLLGFFAITCILIFVKPIILWLYLTLVVILALIGLFIVRQIFVSAKNADLIAIPFGPAMLISAFLFIFFSKYLLGLFGNLI